MRDEDRFSCVGCRIMARSVLVFESLASTNAKALELAADGAVEGTVVVAREQTSGRGRHGRTWSSPRGGLYLSFILRPPIVPAEATSLPLLAGLAVSKAISTSCPVVSSLKWPNDVLIGERKVCGILAESSIKGGLLEHIVVGIGVDANIDVGFLPEEFRGTTTSLMSELGHDVDEGLLFRDLMYIMDMLYVRFLDRGPGPILDEWTNRSSTIGKDVSVMTQDGRLEGKALGVDVSGALILKQGKRLTRIDSGDVVHLR
jgi:BirA family biotin operon repressor/biotin-[acetyl-CoA-carboxylase] ligase